MTEAVYLSTLGGLAVQLLTLVEVRNLPKSRRPDFKDFVYWLPFVINPFFGGLIGYAYFNHQPEVNSLLAIHIGASAPLVVRTMSTVIPAGLRSIAGQDKENE